MLDQLQAILETEEFEHEGEIRLISVAADDTNISFQFDIGCGSHSGRKIELWQIDCIQLLREYAIVLAEQEVATYYYPSLPADDRNSGADSEKSHQKKLSVFIYGPSYVIAPDFQIKKVSERDAICN